MMPISTPKPAKENRTTLMMEQVFEFRDLAFAWEFGRRLGFHHDWRLSQNNFYIGDATYPCENEGGENV